MRGKLRKAPSGPKRKAQLSSRPGVTLSRKTSKRKAWSPSNLRVGLHGTEIQGVGFGPRQFLWLRLGGADRWRESALSATSSSRSLSRFPVQAAARMTCASLFFISPHWGERTAAPAINCTHAALHAACMASNSSGPKNGANS
jgi:hypothetical protein